MFKIVACFMAFVFLVTVAVWVTIGYFAVQVVNSIESTEQVGNAVGTFVSDLHQGFNKGMGDR